MLVDLVLDAVRVAVMYIAVLDEGDRHPVQQFLQPKHPKIANLVTQHQQYFIALEQMGEAGDRRWLLDREHVLPADQQLERVASWRQGPEMKAAFEVCA
jgi:hypothetical protein